MPITDENRRLADLNEFLKSHGESPLIQTLLPFILPTGYPAAFAVDAEGHVVGFKFASPPAPQDLIERLLSFEHLQRLVFHVGSRADFSIPVEISKLKHLRLLSISGRIKRLPETILDLHLPIIVREAAVQSESLDEASLVQVSLMDSAMNKLGVAMGRLERRKEESDQEQLPLEPALLGHVNAGEESYWFKESLNLAGIILEHVKLEDPPLEIATKGRDAIASYFRERRAGYLPLNEVKVILVGNGSSGKTSLVKRVFGEQFDPQESQTHGINIRRLALRTNVSGDVNANFWDFGGQEIMHATHQFFLSKRSLYILVLDGRKEEDPEYWLQHIESFGGDSPVMVVLNKIDEHPAFEVNRRFLTAKYPGISGFFRVSCATGLGVSDFNKSVHEELDRVPILQTKWPRNWFRVKEQLENLESDYISVAQYIEVCEKEQIVDQVSQETLVDFLHDLGVILHFRDLQLLDTHVLDPRWVTEGVYRIINSELLAKQKGLLRLGQLSGVLASNGTASFRYSADKYAYIVELMLKFELCYRVGDAAILVPDLLDIQEPELDFESHNALRFTFAYKYLPKSVMPRFMVRMHKDIRKAMRWRTGVELEDKAFKALAVVRADEKAKKIDIFVNGNQKRDYFSAIRKVITDINASFEKLEVTELVPLPDAPDISLDYRELIGHELGGREEIFVGRLTKAYNVQFLLNGLEEKAVRQVAYGQTIINVKGNYFEQARGVYTALAQFDQSSREGAEQQLIYHPQIWEKIIAYGTAIFFVGVVSFLAIRNQPIADPNIVVLLRILLSLVVAVFGATVPGMLRIDLTSKKGLAIRATGALALFVLAFFETPKVLSH